MEEELVTGIQGTTRLPSFVTWHMTTLAVYVLALCPAFFEVAASFAFATVLYAVGDMLGPLFPLVLVPARCFQFGVSLFRLPRYPFFRFGHLLRLAGGAVSHQITTQGRLLLQPAQPVGPPAGSHGRTASEQNARNSRRIPSVPGRG